MMKALRILVVGKGGREHALCATLHRCGQEQGFSSVELFCAPGSDAIEEIATRLPAESVSQIVEQAKKHKIDLVVVGEEKWLTEDEGLANACVAAHLPCWGPLKAAAEMEASKSFAKEFMARHHIPTADFLLVHSEDEAWQAINEEYPTVLKYDGLAAGKGVAVCQNREAAAAFLEEVFQAKRFGDGPLLIEKALTGPEISVFAAVSDEHYRIIASACDYKRLLDGDEGPNTGGMGSVASLELLDQELLREIDENIVSPTVAGLKKDKLRYRGFLYFGLMITPTGPQVIEYNVRFGDPECQAVMPTIIGDFARFLFDGARGKLTGATQENSISLLPGWSVALCAASHSYPASSRSGDLISGLDSLPEEIEVFHAGSRKNPQGNWETAGGRVLALVSHDSTLEGARQRVYRAMEQVHFDGRQIRTDIGANLP